MPADLESMFFKGSVPWHKSGTKIPDDKVLNANEARVAAGLDWCVNTQDLITVAKAQEVIDYTHGGLNLNGNVDENPPSIKSNVNHKAVVRSTDGAILGVVGPRWRPYQNKEMVDWFKPFIESGEAAYHTGGSLCGGSKVWMLCTINRDNCIIAKGDEIQKYLMLSTAHDGSAATKVGYTPIRIVCNNTLRLAHSANLSQLIRVRHSAQASSNLEAIRETIDLVNQTFEASAEKYRWLANRQINPTDLRKYVKIVLGVDNQNDDDIKTRTHNVIDKIIGLCESGQGNRNPAVRNTYWTAYNGITEYLNYHQGRNESTRLNNLWFGTSLNMNQKALDLALKMAV